MVSFQRFKVSGGSENRPNGLSLLLFDAIPLKSFSLSVLWLLSNIRHFHLHSTQSFEKHCPPPKQL
jgi:hypothetical protein